ncbi:MAG: NAD-dependent malic enzyme, partial [Chloroflexi bacterium]|nr:NAD-dependent malic enzyme [Chloroflexota bacterium]
MSWENKILRIVRVVNAQEIGTLGRLLTAITAVGGNVGNIELLNESTTQVVRDITIFADDEKQLELILEAIRKNHGTKLLDVRDEVMALHLKGKIAVRSRYPIDSIATLQKVYTPGVAEVCMKIAKDPKLAHTYTSISHLVAIVTDGTAVLGLGDIGPLAGMPVMEGKAMLMETLVGLSGVPILLNTKDPDEIIKIVAAIAPTFAAIQLEDISAPRCFRIEEELQKKLDIPVMHDDQHGTAVVTTAVLTVACRKLKKDLGKAVIGQIGLGAAGNAIAKILMRITGNPVWGADLSEEALVRHEANGGKRSILKEIMANCDIVVSTTGVQGLINPEMVRKGQV